MPTLPLNKLTAYEGNVRKIRDKADVKSIAASIKAHGLLHPLTVQTDGKKGVVVDGVTRLLALQLLVKDGDLKSDFAVPYTEPRDDVELQEISLAANTVRTNMHPADECEAFAKLVEAGEQPADIGARVGKTQRYVEQRLRLARGLSKKVMKVFREGKMKLSQAEAFTVTDDFDKQDELLAQIGDRWESATYVTEPESIREHLTEEQVSGSDRRVKYVGLEIYEKAGGKFHRDLFGGEADCFILDVDLLDKLAAEKLEKTKATIEKEGWKWVEVHPGGLTGNQNRFQTIYAKGKWTKEQLSYAGAIVSIGYDGKASVERGRVRPGDMPKPKSTKGKKKSAGEDDGVEAAEAAAEGMPRKLVEDLLKHKDQAYTAHLAAHSRRMLPYVAFEAADNVFSAINRGIFDIRFEDRPFGGKDETIAGRAIEELRRGWGEQLPDDEDELLKWCLSQKDDVLVNLICFCASLTFAGGDFISDVSELTKETGFDMTKYFTATAENYFSHIGKEQILDDIKDAAGVGGTKRPVNAAMKKGELAKIAEEEVAGKAWLPKILR